MFEGTHLVGLDLGSSAIKAVQLKPHKSGFELVKFGFEPLPPQSIVDRHVMNPQVVRETIQALLAKAQIRQKEVAIAVSGASVIIKKITLPMMNRDELAEQIPWEAEQHIPFNIHDVDVDHQVLQVRPEQGQMDILLVAAKKEDVAQYVSLVDEAGLKAAVVDICAFAIQNAFEANYGAGEGTVALVDVGATLTTINIVAHGVTMFTRDISHGSQFITEEIQRRMQVDFATAEAYKVGAEAPGGTEVVPNEAVAVIRQSLDSLAGEIQRSLDFYLKTADVKQVDRIYVSGGTARNSGLLEAVQARTNAPAERFDPLRRVHVDARRVDVEWVKGLAPHVVVALGLALRKTREKRS
ncbi:MAG: type IV pilus assembly protein PilM [Deltaproteobacteria bacterium]|nr:type IV pilus assembly protein PilM [Deltaproteobacteria bacterium]